MILIGSRALALYDLDRKCIDWDFIGNQKELDYLKSLSSNIVENDFSTVMRIDGDIVEFSLEKPADKLIYTLGSPKYFRFGKYFEIPDLEGLLAIKEATADFLNREKHFEDINWIHTNYPEIERDEALYLAKHEEIKERVEKATANKLSFFHKYHDIEYIEHDKLHDLVSTLLFDGYPAFQYFVHKDTKISVDAWKALSHELKIQRFVEESLVLTLERWFVPKLLKRGVHNPHIKKHMVKMANVLAQHTIRGLRDEPKFMSEFGKENTEEILTKVETAAKRLVDIPFPDWFYETLLRIRLNE